MSVLLRIRQFKASVGAHLEFSAESNCTNQPTNQPYRPLELLVRPERDASSGSQVRAIILGLVPTLVSSCGIQLGSRSGVQLGSNLWGPVLGSSSGVHFWGPVLGSIFGADFWGPVLGSIFGVQVLLQLWGRFLGSK